jgi:hypothetical protein
MLVIQPPPPKRSTVPTTTIPTSIHSFI